MAITHPHDGHVLAIRMTAAAASEYANCSLPAGGTRYRLDIPGRPAECNWLDVVGHAVSTAWQGSRSKRRPWLAPPTRVPLESSHGVPPLLLLGVLSGSVARRHLVRCTWGGVLLRLPGGVRLRFVVGNGGSDQDSPDILHVPVDEYLQGGKKNGQWVKNRARTFSMYSTWVKFVYFLRFAATQPEAAVGIADDDVFIQPHMLLAHVSLLHQHASSNTHDSDWIAGAFEWYSLRSESLLASGWARDLQSALWKAQRPWRNCSPEGVGWSLLPTGQVGPELPASAARAADACYGPFGFIKGPLMLLSLSVVRWVVRCASFESDVRRASELAEGKQTGVAAARFERLPQDVILGSWLRHHPRIRYVRIAFFGAWCEEFRHVGELHRLLVAHRVPWDQYRWLLQQTELLWARAHSFPRPYANGRLRCTGAPCQPGLCAHLQSQRACAIEVTVPWDAKELPYNEAQVLRQEMGCARCNCWVTNAGVKTYAGGRCNFSRLAIPALPQHCWLPSGALPKLARHIAESRTS
ncbi:hypothetical protein AB1Y20_020090 [Prymnesium parvum]|uniref:Hexosyltransferase n=1 Tax=Prymnesium parvum TaxID=97485 RepID=A0AB34JW46_PRYPA